MSKNKYMKKIGEKAKIASITLSNLNGKKKNSVLKLFYKYLKTNSKLILNANKKDLSNAKKINPNMVSRLELNNVKIDSMRKAINQIINFIFLNTVLDVQKEAHYKSFRRTLKQMIVLNNNN